MGPDWPVSGGVRPKTSIFKPTASGCVPSRWQPCRTLGRSCPRAGPTDAISSGRSSAREMAQPRSAGTAAIGHATCRCCRASTSCSARRAGGPSWPRTLPATRSCADRSRSKSCWPTTRAAAPAALDRGFRIGARRAAGAAGRVRGDLAAAQQAQSLPSV
eukprot:scaffold6382_cov110-Isochrysis_galbana.AAC.3